MMALSVAYQKERQNVEANDLTALVIRALGMIGGKLIRDEGELGDRGDRGELNRKRYFLLTATITQASQGLAEILEQDITPDEVTSRKLGSVLRKMRLPSSRQPKTGKKGWMVSLFDVIRWSQSYGLDPSNITGLNISTHISEFTPVTSVTSVTPIKDSRCEGIL
jgi:hypothetical protein